MEELQYIVVIARVSKELNNNASTLHGIPEDIINGAYLISPKLSAASIFLTWKRIEAFIQKNLK